jgi:hypothetical protein
MDSPGARERKSKALKNQSIIRPSAPSTNNSFEILNQTLENQEMEGDLCQNPPSMKRKRQSINPYIFIEQITLDMGLSPVVEEKILNDGGDMEIELDEKELAGIDLVSLKEAYRKQELLPSLMNNFKNSIRSILIPHRSHF